MGGWSGQRWRGIFLKECNRVASKTCELSSDTYASITLYMNISLGNMLLPKSECHSIENAKEAKPPCLPGSVLFHIRCFFADPIGNRT